MSNFNVVRNYQTVESGKFIELEGTKFPPVSVTRFSYPDTTSAFPGNSAAEPLSSVDIYPKYGVLTHITNFADMPIVLSAADVQIGGVEIKDWNSDLRADVTESDGLNALRVLTQDLESSVDDITIGDKNSNFATIDASTSALNVKVTNPVTQVTTTPEATQLDAFGRLRVSNSFTLFDSSHRYGDNNLWSTLSANGGWFHSTHDKD
jgi:hypothetical protein